MNRYDNISTKELIRLWIEEVSRGVQYYEVNRHPDSFHDLNAVDWQADKLFPGQSGEPQAD